MKSPLTKRTLAIPGRLQSFYHFLPTALQHGVIALAVSFLLLALAAFGGV